MIITDTELTAIHQFYRQFTYLEWQEILLPCRPSMPDVNVSYSKQCAMLPPPLFSFNHSLLEYDPMIGFHRSDARADSDTGCYTCAYTRGDSSVEQIINVHVTRK